MNSQPDPRRWKALALLCVAFFMVILDTQVMTVMATVGSTAGAGHRHPGRLSLGVPWSGSS